MVQVHVNSNTIRKNAKHGTNDPPLTIRRGSSVEYAHAIEIVGPARIVYEPGSPLRCGARVWIAATDAIAVQPQPAADAA